MAAAEAAAVAAAQTAAPAAASVSEEKKKDPEYDKLGRCPLICRIGAPPHPIFGKSILILFIVASPSYGTP